MSKYPFLTLREAEQFLFVSGEDMSRLVYDTLGETITNDGDIVPITEFDVKDLTFLRLARDIKEIKGLYPSRELFHTLRKNGTSWISIRIGATDHLIEIHLAVEILGTHQALNDWLKGRGKLKGPMGECGQIWGYGPDGEFAWVWPEGKKE